MSDRILTKNLDPLVGLAERMTSLTVRYQFNGKGVTETGAIILDRRTVACIGSDGETAWKRSFHTRSEAIACFTGDIRAMRKNDCYQWLA